MDDDNERYPLGKPKERKKESVPLKHPTKPDHPPGIIEGPDGKLSTDYPLPATPKTAKSVKDFADLKKLYTGE